MTQPQKRPRREKGQFGDPDTSPSNAWCQPKRGQTHAHLRGTAFRLIEHLEQMLPPLRLKDVRKSLAEKGPAEPQNAAEPEETAKTDKAADTGEAATTREPPPTPYDRLLSRNDGVIDGFKTLAVLIVDLYEKERDIEAASRAAAHIHNPKIDEDELDRRIEAELDLIDDERRSAAAG